MKRIILGLTLIIGITFSFAFTTNNSSFQKLTTEINKCKYAQCSATAKSTGNRCKHCVSNDGDLYCWQHE